MCCWVSQIVLSDKHVEHQGQRSEDSWELQPRFWRHLCEWQLKTTWWIRTPSSWRTPGDTHICGWWRGAGGLEGKESGESWGLGWRQERMIRWALIISSPLSPQSHTPWRTELIPTDNCWTVSFYSVQLTPMFLNPELNWNRLFWYQLPTHRNKILIPWVTTVSRPICFMETKTKSLKGKFMTNHTKRCEMQPWAFTFIKDIPNLKGSRHHRGSEDNRITWDLGKNLLQWFSNGKPFGLGGRGWAGQ